MHISMDEETIESLKISLKEKNKAAVRIVIQGFG
jgi:hypothetical protein